MCEASIHVPHRRARGQEKLVVQPLPNMGGWAGLYPFNPSNGDTKLVCTRGQTKAILKQVRLQKGLPPNLVRAWGSKKNIEVVLFRQYHHDMVKFPDGQVISLVSLQFGTRIDIGIPVKRRKPGGMQMISRAIKEAMALPPDPKPGDEPKHDEPRNPQREPAEPTPEPAPQREPERS
jgi:hypothetical protein